MIWIAPFTLWKNWGFAIKLVMKFLSYHGHMQLRVFLWHECHQLSCNSYIEHIKTTYINIYYKKVCNYFVISYPRQLATKMHVNKWNFYMVFNLSIDKWSLFMSCTINIKLLCKFLSTSISYTNARGKMCAWLFIHLSMNKIYLIQLN
jgi:uncharacterized protein YpbB